MKLDREIRSVLIFFVILGLLWAVYFIGSGFTTAADAWVTGAVVSEDGKTLTLSAGVAGSAGYIRDAKEELDGDTMYLSFYHGFGGINGHIGVKNPITVPIPENCTEIYAKGIYQSDGPVRILHQTENTWRQG